MRIVYPVRIQPSESSGFIAQGLPPLTGVMTWGATREEAETNAVEALTGVLETMLDHGMAIPDPAEVLPDGGNGEAVLVEPEPSAAVPILLRKAREAAGLTQTELASRLDITYQAVQKWERSGANPTVATVQRALRALGQKLEMRLVPR